MSMVERVARAMERNSGIRAAPNWWLKQARAAIEAMREPPAAVWIAMMNTKDDGTGELHFRKWKAAITAALGEGE